MLYEVLHCVIWPRFTIVYEEPAASNCQVEEPFLIGGHSLLLNVDIFMSVYITSHSIGNVYGHYHENLIFHKD